MKATHVRSRLYPASDTRAGATDVSLAGAKLSSSHSISSYHFQNPPPTHTEHPLSHNTLIYHLKHMDFERLQPTYFLLTSPERGLVMEVMKYLELAPVLVVGVG